MSDAETTPDATPPKKGRIHLTLAPKADAAEPATPDMGQTTSRFMEKQLAKQGEENYRRFDTFIRDKFGSRLKPSSSWAKPNVAEKEEPVDPDSPHLPREPVNITFQNNHFELHVPPDFDEARLAALGLQQNQYYVAEASNWVVPTPIMQKLFEADQRISHLDHLSNPSLPKDQREHLEDAVTYVTNGIRNSENHLPENERHIKHARVIFSYRKDGIPPDPGKPGDKGTPGDPPLRDGAGNEYPNRESYFLISQLPPGYDMSRFFTPEDLKQVTRIPVEKVIYIPQDIALAITPKSLGK